MRQWLKHSKWGASSWINKIISSQSFYHSYRSGVSLYLDNITGRYLTSTFFWLTVHWKFYNSIVSTQCRELNRFQRKTTKRWYNRWKGKYERRNKLGIVNDIALAAVSITVSFQPQPFLFIGGVNVKLSRWSYRGVSKKIAIGSNWNVI
jgi:hypothetical protein